MPSVEALGKKVIVVFRLKNGKVIRATCDREHAFRIREALNDIAEMEITDEEELVSKTTVVSESLYKDRVYKPGKFFVVNNPFENTDEIKICVAVCTALHGGKQYRKILWNDGSFTEEYYIPFAQIVKPLRGDSLWMFEAEQAFKKILNGTLSCMTITTAAGDTIVVTRNVKIRSSSARKKTAQTDLAGKKKPEAIIKAGQKMIVVGEEKARIFEKENKKKRSGKNT